MTKDHLNESEIYDSEKEFGIQASQEMIDAETQASNQKLETEIITLKEIIEQCVTEIKEAQEKNQQKDAQIQSLTSQL